MTFPIRVLTIVTGATVLSSVLSAQTTLGVMPDTTIGVQLQVLPFSVAPAPRVSERVLIDNSVTGWICRMPVDGTNTSADTAMASRSSATVTPVPMPGANSMTACRNPLRQAPTGMTP